MLNHLAKARFYKMNNILISGLILAVFLLSGCSNPDVTLISEREHVTRSSVYRADGRVVLVQSITGMHEQSVFEQTDPATGETSIIEAFPFYDVVRAGVQGGLSVDDRVLVTQAIIAHCGVERLSYPPYFNEDGNYWNAEHCL